MDRKELGQKWVAMIYGLLASIPDRVVQWLNNKDQPQDDLPKHDISTRIIPFVIVALSGASITNLSARAAAHHPAGSGGEWGPYLVGIGLAVLVPVTVFVAIRIKDAKSRKSVWAIAFVFAVVSGTIQTQIYAPVGETLQGFNKFMLWLEALTFGYGVPGSEVLLAWIESNMLKQYEQDVHDAKSQREQQVKVQAENARREQAEADAKQKRDEEEADAKRHREQQLQIEEDTKRAEAQIRLDALRRQVERDDQLERERSAAELQAKLQMSAARAESTVEKARQGRVKAKSQGDSGNDYSGNSAIEERRNKILLLLENNSSLGTGDVVKMLEDDFDISVTTKTVGNDLKALGVHSFGDGRWKKWSTLPVEQ